ncbi:carbonic anhydrase [Streptomyces hainanensis]|nr:carbonic anhydrase family protein [Streptomyces hainanensis]
MSALAGVATLAVVTATLTSAASPSAEADQQTEKRESVHWSYHGRTGPDRWATLSEDFAACGEGREQSPVDLPTDAAIGASSDAAITIDYRPVTADLVNNGHTVQANVSPGSRIVVDGTPYELQQFHFHLPSEHTEDGEHTAMEMHFVHADAAGDLAVVGVLMEREAGESAFTDLWPNLPTEEGGEAAIDEAFDLTEFLPEGRDQYRYDGSLTTPPCTEGVRWIVLDDPVSVTPGQVTAYRHIFHKSNRPTQPLNDRVLTFVED